MGAASNDLDRVHEQRAALAGRVRTPWWYLAAYGAGLALILGTPLATHYVPEVGSLGILIAMLLLMLLDRLLGTVNGARLSRRSLRAYPSSRPAGLAMVAITLVATIGEVVLLNTGRPASAGAVLVLATAAMLGCLSWQTSAIRRDIRDGRAVGA